MWLVEYSIQDLLQSVLGIVHTSYVWYFKVDSASQADSLDLSSILE